MDPRGQERRPNEANGDKAAFTFERPMETRGQKRRRTEAKAETGRKHDGPLDIIERVTEELVNANTAMTNSRKNKLWFNTLLTPRSLLVVALQQNIAVLRHPKKSSSSRPKKGAGKVVK
jgi:hypothetical protein